jgi:hypothetical protein
MVTCPWLRRKQMNYWQRNSRNGIRGELVKLIHLDNCWIHTSTATEQFMSDHQMVGIQWLLLVRHNEKSTGANSDCGCERFFLNACLKFHSWSNRRIGAGLCSVVYYFWFPRLASVRFSGIYFPIRRNRGG